MPQERKLSTIRAVCAKHFFPLHMLIIFRKLQQYEVRALG